MDLKDHPNLIIGEVSHYIGKGQSLAFILPAGTKNVNEFMSAQFERAGIDPKDGTAETAIDIETLNTTLLWTLK